MGIARFATASLIFLLYAAGVSRADPLFDPATGLRMSAYRAPVPPTVPGGQVVTDPVRVARLADSGALLIDVMGAAGYRIREDGTWITAEHHQTLPGAIWLPEIGRGRQEPDIAAYMHQALHVCTDGRKDRPIVIFCLSDCWMSWNAVQHVAAAGIFPCLLVPGRHGHLAADGHADPDGGSFALRRTALRNPKLTGGSCAHSPNAACATTRQPPSSVS